MVTILAFNEFKVLWIKVDIDYLPPPAQAQAQPAQAQAHAQLPPPDLELELLRLTGTGFVFWVTPLVNSEMFPITPEENDWILFTTEAAKTEPGRVGRLVLPEAVGMEGADLDELVEDCL